ncbi:MAG: KamA family radical SAM protein [Pseudomonadota bacterium]
MQSLEHTPDWKKIFASEYVGMTNLDYSCLDISQDELKDINTLFPVQLTQSLLRNHSANSKVLRQYLPSRQELINPVGYNIDPVGDQQATQQDGIIKKYKNRVLLITTHTCPVHCRYCFRKDYPYVKDNPNSHHFKNAISFIEKDSSINEVILSGGDPLSLQDEMLSQLFKTLENIPHVKTIRIHTKFPSIIPERLTNKFLTMLEKCKINTICVFHINHPEEITNKFFIVAKNIQATGTIMLNQSVLLKDVNDDHKILIELSHKLFSAGTLPYYLHMLDPARGTHHFHVEKRQAEAILDCMKKELPGYLVPKLAQEIAGEMSKIY